MTPLCPYCHATVNATRTLCPTCRTPHHEECWDENDGCSVQLCESGPELPYIAAPGAGAVATRERTVITGLGDEDAGDDPQPQTEPDPGERQATGAQRAAAPAGGVSTLARRGGSPRRRILAGAGAAALGAAVLVIALAGGGSASDPAPLTSDPSGDPGGVAPPKNDPEGPPAAGAQPALTVDSLDAHRTLVRDRRERLEQSQKRFVRERRRQAARRAAEEQDQAPTPAPEPDPVDQPSPQPQPPQPQPPSNPTPPPRPRPTPPAPKPPEGELEVIDG